MSTKFILKNKSTQDINNTTGSLAELFIDTSKHSLVVMDGTTAGGAPLALESFVTANSLPDKSSAENNYLTINNSGEPEWVNVDLSLLPIGTIIDSFTDLPSEYFLKFDGTLRSTEDYPEFTDVYTNESVLAIPAVENSPSNFFNRTAYTEMWYGSSASPSGEFRNDLSFPRSTDNMVFDGTYYVRILGQEDLNYNNNIVTQFAARYYYPVIPTSQGGIPSNMLVTYNVSQPPPTGSRIDLTRVAGITQYDSNNNKNFEEAYWETSNGSHRIVIRINMTNTASEIWTTLSLFENNPFTWRTEEQWEIDEQLYNNAENDMFPGNSYDYLRPRILVQYEGQPVPETNVVVPRTWENPLVTVFNIGSVTPPDGTQFKIQRSLDGINWTTFTVAPFSNNATRCYSVLADEDDGKIYMVAQALPNFNPYNPLTITEADGTSDVVVMSSDHGSTWVEIAAPFRNTGRVLTYNNITKSLYLFNGTKLTPFNKAAPLGPENPPKVSVADTQDITIQFNPVQILNNNESYSPYPPELFQYFTNYVTVKNDLLMYIQSHPAQASASGGGLVAGGEEYIESQYTHNIRCGQQISLLVDSVLWEPTNQLNSINSFYGRNDGFFLEADKSKFKNENCFCKVPATFSDGGAIVTPDRIYGIFKYTNSLYKIYVQKDFVAEQSDPYAFTFYADVELPGFLTYNELLFNDGLDSAVDQNGISKFHWSPLFGFMVFTKNKIYYNLDPINNRSWNKINGLDESKNYQFLTCINTPDGVLVSGMNDVVYVTVPDNKFLLSPADTNLLNKYQTSKYIKIK